MDTSYKILAIGDTVVEPFIKLSAGRIEESAHGPELCIPYGTKIPYEEATMVYGVGNSANAAVSTARLGVPTALLTSLGADDNGKKCREHFASEGVIPDHIQTVDGMSTNYHFVLWHGADRTILIKHEEFSYEIPTNLVPPSYIYFSSLGEHTRKFHFELADYCNAHPDTRLMFQPGTFQLRAHDELTPVYKAAHTICVNKEEAMLVTGLDGEDIVALLDALAGYGCEITLITDGPLGAYMKWNNTHFFMPPYPDIAPPYERTGAGDAFFSTFTAYLVRGSDPVHALTRAPINSMSVVQKVGAQEGLLSHSEIENYLSQAPESYKVEIL